MDPASANPASVYQGILTSSEDAISTITSRVENLLDRSVNFLIFSGGQGGEYISNLINIYKGVDISTNRSLIGDQQVNRTQIHYPCIIKESLAWPHSLIFKSRNELLDFLDQKNLLTLTNIEDAEQYLALDPILRTHEVNPNLFKNYNSSFFIANAQWREYCLALMSIKHQFPKSSAVDDFILLQQGNQRPLAPSHPLEEIRAYVDSLSVTHVDVIRLRALIVGRGPRAPSIAWAFEQPLSLLHNIYCNHYHPSFEMYQNQLDLQKKSSRGPIHELDYGRVISDPGYLASHFQIEDAAEFYQELSQWHQTNKNLMQIYGFDQQNHLPVDS